MNNSITPSSIESFGALKMLLDTTANGKPSHKITEKKLTAKPPLAKFDTTPSYIYFYKIGFNSTGQLGVTQTLYHEAFNSSDAPADRRPIAHADVPSKISWMQSGRIPPNQLAKEESFGRNFKNDNPHWNRVSYLAFLIDHPNWTFCDTDELPPAVFEEKRTGGSNHTYSDGQVISIVTSNGPRSLFYCVNHLRKRDQQHPADIDDRENFKYDLFTQFNFPGGSDPIVLIFDPGGTNLGPPLPPY